MSTLSVLSPDGTTLGIMQCRDDDLSTPCVVCRVRSILECALDYIERVPDDRLNAEHIDRDDIIRRIKDMLTEPTKSADTQSPL